MPKNLVKPIDLAKGGRRATGDGLEWAGLGRSSILPERPFLAI